MFVDRDVYGGRRCQKKKLSNYSWSWIRLLVSLLCTPINGVHAFSFSEAEEQEQLETEAATQQTRQKLSVPCRKALKRKKIAVLIGEYHNGGRIRSVPAAGYGRHFHEINTRLKQLGLRTYTQAEINHQIAQAEITAALNNDPDAALSAASRLGANFVLRGIIRTRSRYNPIVRTNEVFVDMAFTLSDARGRLIADVSAEGDAWAGADTQSVALDLIREQASGVVGDLYYDYCTKI